MAETSQTPAGVFAAAPSRTLQCVVVTPERAVFDDQADFVALPMYDGELGVLPSRAPMIGRLGAGELRVRKGTDTRRFFVDSGFAQVRSNVVTVLTERAIRAEDIDEIAASQTLQATPEPDSTAESRAAQWKAKERARAQLRVVRRAQE
jgi:F-type H+-transporting ATPase subunit epsilon